jgi:enoyl-CoA hydratase/carnithine racemase
VLVLELEGERGNALSRPILGELEEALTALGDARVVVLRGAGEKSFSTGYDVSELVRELEGGPSVQDEASHPLEKALRALERCPVPTIALVHGTAYGAGLELATTCDLRIAADDARFCMPPAKLGILYSATGLARFLELVGPQATKELFFTGEPIDAPRALSIGLVARVVPKASATAEAFALARTIEKNAPLSVRNTKAVIALLRAPGLNDEARAAVARLREECFRSSDFRAAARAFLEKRGPVEFEGK